MKYFMPFLILNCAASVVGDNDAQASYDNSFEAVSDQDKMQQKDFMTSILIIKQRKINFLIMKETKCCLAMNIG